MMVVISVILAIMVITVLIAIVVTRVMLFIIAMAIGVRSNSNNTIIAVRKNIGKKRGGFSYTERKPSYFLYIRAV